MRVSVIIALVVVGGAVVVTPVIAEYLLQSGHQANVFRLLEKPGINRVDLMREEIGIGLKLGCWVTGTALAVAGIYLAIQQGREGVRGQGHSAQRPAEPVATPDRPREERYRAE